MKFVSGLLFALARSHEASVLSGNEGEIQVGTELSPILQLPFPQKNLATFSATAVQRESFAAAVARTHAPSTAEGSTTLATFSQGLWEWTLQLDSASDFSQAGVNDSVRGELLDPLGTVTAVGRTFPTANVAQHITQTFLSLFAEDGWQLRLTVTATAAGQNQKGSLAVYANRLL